MKVAVIYNKIEISDSDVINVFGMRTKESYNPKIVELVASGLEKGGHNVRTIEGNRNVIDELQNFMPRVVKGERPGMVFNMAYGIQGQSRYTHIPAMLEMLGIPYIGSGPTGHAIALDKVLAKIIFMRHKLPTPAFWLVAGPEAKFNNLRYPVIVKPKMEAVSFGLRLAWNEQELREAIELITREFQQQALVEEFIQGREFAVGLMGNGPNLESLPIVEIDLGSDPNAFQTYEDKSKHPRPKICPADIPPELAGRLRELASSAFNAVGLCDFARVDFRMDPKGHLYILEINSMASLNLTGSFVHAADVAGLDFTALVNRMLDVAAVRYFGSSHLIAEEKEDKPAKNAQPLHVRVRSYLRSHLTTIVDSLEHMVGISSHTNNIEGVNTLGNWISGRFQHLGFQRQVFPQTETGNILYFTNHLEERNDILLLGHLDTIHDYRSHAPFHEERGRIMGSGVAESKGGIAVILAALQALRFSRVLRNIRCGVLLTADDCTGGRFSKKLIAEIALRSGCVVGTKYGDLSGGIVTSCAGAQEYLFEMTNNKNHKNQKAPDVASALSQKILALKKLTSEKKGIRIIINSSSACTNAGRIPDHGTATITACFMSKDQGAELDREVRKIAEKGTNGALQVQVRFGARRPPVAATKANLRLFDTVQQLAKKQEVRIEAVHRDFPADICHVPENVPVLGGFGPLGGDARSPNEYIVRDSLIDRSALLALVIFSVST
ncbi:MAG: M20/M25/M40 family metallo-hydrolase [Candidatus Latescibacteria bacterium]|nr:M20/M25/M40 family metallo-hydrolase [Candidatus Latescibacterota bacterium]NIO57283.1 M20/M25/M40 family metallo-hydrolase [Candidatus Latescibacterota bacterium]